MQLSLKSVHQTGARSTYHMFIAHAVLVRVEHRIVAMTPELIFYIKCQAQHLSMASVHI